MKFISIDPSLTNTGVVWGEVTSEGDLIDLEYELIETIPNKSKTIRKSSDLIQRCSFIFKNINRILEKVCPKVSFIETPSGSQNYSSAISYAVSCYSAAIISPPPIEITPTEVKVSTVGDKAASKLKMINYVNSKYPNLLKQRKGVPLAKMEHIADAVCVAEAGIKSNVFLQLKTFNNA